VESLEHELQIKATIKEEKALYTQNTWSRGRSQGSLKKQHIVTLSTCKSRVCSSTIECLSLSMLRNILSKFEHKQENGTVVQVDNKSVIELAKNSVNYERSKHIDVHFHFIWERVKEENVEMVHIGSREQVADMFTKSLPIMLFNSCKKLIGMRMEEAFKFTGKFC